MLKKPVSDRECEKWAVYKPFSHSVRAQVLMGKIGIEIANTFLCDWVYTKRSSVDRCFNKVFSAMDFLLTLQFTHMPVMQLFTPANPVALTLDHGYCPGLNTDVFLKNEKISFITAEDVAEIEQRTRGQSASLKWQEEHQKRITASNFGKICKAKTMDMNKFARSLMHQQTLHTPPILHGKKYEHLAVEKFELQTGLKTSNCGLYISEECPFLAASPDAIINNRSIPVEVKCPYVSRSKTIDSITVPYLDKGLLTLDSKHDYYYQVQGQIMCTGADFCHFVVYTFKDLKYMQIERDNEFIAIMKDKLIYFYENHFKQAVIDKHMYRDYTHIF